MTEGDDTQYSEPFVYTADWYDRVYGEGVRDSDADGDFGIYAERDVACLASVSPTPADSVLVCGCGGGQNAGMLAWRWGVHRLTLVDWSDRAVRICRHRFPNAWTIKADVQDMPFKDRSFTLILAMDLTEHLPEEVYMLFLREVKRLLVPYVGRAVFLPGMTVRPEHVNLRDTRQIANDLASTGFFGLIGNKVWVTARTT